jgi:hypothetical protein
MTEKCKDWRWPTSAPLSSGHILIFNTLAANDSASFRVSLGPIAANIRIPFPIEETVCLSTDTEADATRCSITGLESLKAVPGNPLKLTFHCRRLESNFGDV